MVARTRLDVTSYIARPITLKLTLLFSRKGMRETTFYTHTEFTKRPFLTYWPLGCCKTREAISAEQ